MAQHPKLTPLGELFEHATRTGVEELTFADRLLEELKAGLTAYGYRRQFTYLDSGGRKERLPRDTHRQPIPHFFWQYIESVSGALESKWFDDPEEPDDWAIMDWASGSFQSIEFDMENYDRIEVQFHTIAVEAKVGQRLLAELAGKQTKRRGAPKGLRNAWERDQAQKGFEMILAGDQRPHPEIALSLVHRDTPEREVGNQKRRILAGVRMLLSEAENSEPK